MLVAREITVGIRHTSQYNQLKADFYHPKFVARQLGLEQHIPLPYESLDGSLKWEGMVIVDLSKLLKANNKKFTAFTWDNYRKTIGETNAYTGRWPTIRK